MMNLIIGLLVGVASAIALVIMWHMAERLRRDLDAEQNDPNPPRRRRVDEDPASRDGAS